MCGDSREAWVPDLTLWNMLPRREQRILVKLVGGGSTRGDHPTEMANLMQLGLVGQDGLTAAGLKVFIAAFKAQREARRIDLVA